MVRFKFLTGDVNWKEYGGKFVSQRLANGNDAEGAVQGVDYDFHYWFVMDVRPNDSGDEPKYWVSLSVVSPEAADEKELQAAVRAQGIPDDELPKYLADQFFLMESLYDYGVCAVVWHSEGNNLGKLMKEARKEAQLAEMMFGFYMDRPQNALGSTGRDTVRGDLWAGAKR